MTKRTHKLGISDAKQPPASTPQARENQLIALAENLAEQQLREGTASSQVITHYLKLGTQREMLERERLEKENALLEAKKKAIESQEATERLYAEALKAMRVYSGSINDGGSEDDF